MKVFFRLPADFGASRDEFIGEVSPHLELIRGNITSNLLSALYELHLFHVKKTRLSLSL